MEQQVLEELQTSLKSGGPGAAIDRLCEELKGRKEYAALFYTLLMKKRLDLGVSPIATGSNQDLPESSHEAFEDGIREAARTVGQLWLQDGELPQAWTYFRMIGETKPLSDALEKIEPSGMFTSVFDDPSSGSNSTM